MTHLPAGANCMQMQTGWLTPQHGLLTAIHPPCGRPSWTAEARKLTAMFADPAWGFTHWLHALLRQGRESWGSTCLPFLLSSTGTGVSGVWAAVITGVPVTTSSTSQAPSGRVCRCLWQHAWCSIQKPTATQVASCFRSPQRECGPGASTGGEALRLPTSCPPACTRDSPLLLRVGQFLSIIRGVIPQLGAEPPCISPDGSVSNSSHSTPASADLLREQALCHLPLTLMAERTPLLLRCRQAPMKWPLLFRNALMQWFTKVLNVQGTAERADMLLFCQWVKYTGVLRVHLWVNCIMVSWPTLHLKKRHLWIGPA